MLSAAGRVSNKRQGVIGTNDDAFDEPAATDEMTDTPAAAATTAAATTAPRMVPLCIARTVRPPIDLARSTLVSQVIDRLDLTGLTATLGT